MSDSDGKSTVDDLDWSDVQAELNESIEMAEEKRAAAKDDDKTGTKEKEGDVPPKQGPLQPPPKPVKAAPKREVSPVQFDELGNRDGSKGALDLDFILEIPLKVSAELGRSRMLVSELLSLGTGSVIELDKAAGEPVDVFVNNRLIARGEVVVTNEKFGVRLTDVVSHTERINNLK